MEKAGKILQKPYPLSLKETAALCGYEDIYHFSKSFSKFHKVPPGRYRDNFQLK
jgi:transcriptional regulator GlxA family with amidase domain